MVRRGGFLRRPVLAALLLAGCGEQPQAPPPGAPPPSEVERLAAALADPVFRVREEAEKALFALAPSRYEEIDRLRQAATDLEAQGRLDRILGSPRVLLAAAWLGAKKDGKEDLVLGERWFRWEQEQESVGYQRLEARRDPDGRLAFVFELETQVDQEREHTLLSYVCTEDLRPLSLHAELTPAWGAETAVLDGEMKPEGWEIRRRLVEETQLRIPWGPDDFPQEVILLLLPAWMRMGGEGREVPHQDIQYPDMTMTRQLLRDEGKGRATLRPDGSDKASCTILLGADGRIRTFQFDNNLRAEAVTAEEGRRIRDVLRAKPFP